MGICGEKISSFCYCKSKGRNRIIICIPGLQLKTSGLFINLSLYCPVNNNKQCGYEQAAVQWPESSLLSFVGQLLALFKQIVVKNVIGNI